jgi:hypothetical protein
MGYKFLFEQYQYSDTQIHSYTCNLFLEKSPSMKGLFLPIPQPKLLAYLLVFIRFFAHQFFFYPDL